MTMANKVELRYTRVSDAKRILEIMSNPNFIYTNRKTCTLDDEKEKIRTFSAKRKSGEAFIYVILFNGKVVGGCDLNVNQRTRHIAAIGYFIDEAYWGKNIAARAVRKITRIGFNELGLKRLEILMVPENAASERVAVKCGFQKEGTLRKRVYINGKLCDAHLYARVK